MGGYGAGVIDITFFTVWTVTVSGNQQGWVYAATTQSHPHEDQVKEEEQVRKQNEAPCNRHGPNIGISSQSSGFPWLVKLFLANSLHPSTENSNDCDGDDAVDGEEEMHLDQAT